MLRRCQAVARQSASDDAGSPIRTAATRLKVHRRGARLRQRQRSDRRGIGVEGRGFSAAMASMTYDLRRHQFRQPASVNCRHRAIAMRCDADRLSEWRIRADAARPMP